MPRQVPDCPEKPQHTSAGLIERTFEIELITPMFGGGVEPRVNDRTFPIRPTAIRGQLQFWWRATMGGLSSNLWLREEEIFGSTRSPSPLDVRVSLDPETEPTYADASEVDRFGPDGYALFALQRGDKLLREGFKFKIDVSWISRERMNEQRAAVNKQLVKAHEKQLPTDVPDISNDLEVAIWAWMNFGGLGGRTRRGCGALFGREVNKTGDIVRELAPKSVSELSNWLSDNLGHVGPLDQTESAWPEIGKLMVERRPVDAIHAWLDAIRTFKEFRQGIEFGRDRGQRKPQGRSRYPEAETIREIPRLGTDRKRSGHPRMPEVPADAFPRAELGLPIVFQFQGSGEPPQTVLYPSSDSDGRPRERMASPLILKPLALASGQAIPLILRLNTPALSGVVLRQGDNVLELPATTVIRDARLSMYRNSPLAGSPNGSALEAFLAFAESKGFAKVTQ